MSAAGVVYYALGNGLGHVARTVALARHYARIAAGPHTVLANTRFVETAAALVALEPRLRLQLLPAELTPQAARREVPRWLDRERPSLLVVDTFPRGLVGELAPWFASGCSVPVRQRVLVSRQLPVDYVDRFGLRDFTDRNYARVIIPGESSPLESLPQARRTEPFLLRNFAELPDRRRAAELLRVAADTGAIVLAASGSFEEVGCWREWSESLAGRWPDDLPPLRMALPRETRLATSSFDVRLVGHLPLLEGLPAARLVLGAAGYNLTAETRALGIPALQLPAKRKYDDQSSRLTSRPLTWEVDATLLRIRAAQREWPPTIRPYVNGAEEAAQEIAAV